MTIFFFYLTLHFTQCKIKILCCNRQSQEKKKIRVVVRQIALIVAFYRVNDFTKQIPQRLTGRRLCLTIMPDRGTGPQL